jgi:hypothetical protein
MQSTAHILQRSRALLLHAAAWCPCCVLSLFFFDIECGEEEGERERGVGGGIEWRLVPVCTSAPVIAMHDVDVGLRFNQQAAHVNVAHRSSQKEGALVPDPAE